MTKTAIVTGSTGFIGLSLTKYLLKKGYRVFAVTRDVSQLNAIRSDRLIAVKAGFSEYKSLPNLIPNADIFYHFAWEGVYGKKAINYAVQLKNIEASCDALIQARTIGCKKFVFIGSVSELEIRDHLEKNVCNPRGACIYATAKLSAEMMLKTLAVQNDMLFNCGLLANTIGPGDFSQRSTNTIIQKMLRHESPALVKGDGLNDWLYIDDAVRLIEAMGEKGVNLKSYYIGHRKLWPLRKTIEKARDIVAPELKLTFGKLPDQFLTNYTYINPQELFLDTGYKAETDFETSVRNTMIWNMKIIHMD